MLIFKELKQIKFEESGSIFFNKVKKELHVVHTHYNVAPTVWKVDHNKNIFTLVKETESPFPMDAYKIYYTAHNGKKVPIWILKKSDVVLSNKTPCYIYGYGGFRVNLLPAYNEEYLPWLKKGGCIAFVTLPGGLEYGENWHKEGAGLNKINVFNDFANAARTLYMSQVSSPDKAGIGGASNGGLLVAATMNLYPKLFQAAVPEVGVLDMTRFELFSGGKWWTKEYGTRYIKKDFHNLFNISPYHQLKPNKYPHTLVITSDLDDRVVPSHSYKYAAKLQELKPWDRVAFLYTRKLSSHSRKSGTINERIKYLSYKWSFLNKTLNW